MDSVSKDSVETMGTVRHLEDHPTSKNSETLRVSDRIKEAASKQKVSKNSAVTASDLESQNLKDSIKTKTEIKDREWKKAVLNNTSREDSAANSNRSVDRVKVDSARTKEDSVATVLEIKRNSEKTLEDMEGIQTENSSETRETRKESLQTLDTVTRAMESLKTPFRDTVTRTDTLAAACLSDQSPHF